MNCTIKDRLDRTECGQPGAVPLAAICEHEHIEHVLACRDHAIGPFICEPCMDAPAGLAHRCYSRIIRHGPEGTDPLARGVGSAPAPPVPAPQDLPRD